MLVSGFDTLDTIASMDEDCDKHIDQVEVFIPENFPDNALYCNPHSTECKFPPGRRIRIKQFVTEAKSLVENRKRKEEVAATNFRKLVRTDEGQKKQQTLTDFHSFSKDEVQNNSSMEQNVTAVKTQVRNTVLKYIKGNQHELGKLKDIKETKSFSILVTRVASQNKGLLSVKIRCEPCGIGIALHQQRKSNCKEAYSIKNWKRHISGCKELLASMQEDKMKQRTLLLSANNVSFSEELSGSSKKCEISLSDSCVQLHDQSSGDVAGINLILMYILMLYELYFCQY